MCAKIGHAIKLCPLNYETIQDAKSAAQSGPILDIRGMGVFF